MNRNLVGSTYGRFCIKFPQSRMKGERQAQPTEPLVLVSKWIATVSSEGVVIDQTNISYFAVIHHIKNK